VPRLRLRCPCGETIDADSEDELVTLAQEHLAAEHPDLAGRYSREDILAMAY
jgi:predicted small metal-binding protein